MTTLQLAKTQEAIKKTVSRKLNKDPDFIKDIMPMTMWAVIKAAAKVLLVGWVVFLLAVHVVLGTLQGIGAGVERGLEESLKSYRGW